MPIHSGHPNVQAVFTLIGAILLERNDEWTVQRSRYMTLESIAALSDNDLVGLPTAAICELAPEIRTIG
jgi:hypothetical protein